ncbi:MAG: LLM class flavin-dependent oxidoreductase [Brumimicrobium sp.]
MELGIGMFGDNVFNMETQQYESSGDRLKEIVEEVKLADDLGIDYFAIGEHHREDYSVAAPEIMLAALAPVTKNIILSSGVNVVSSADPVKLYQDFSMIDLLSNNRAEIMAGRGSFIESFPLFGQNLQNYNELFEEGLELLLKVRSNDVVNWKGQFRAPIVDQTVYPRPEREIPVWIAVGGTPASVERAGRLGLPIIFAIIGGQWRQFGQLIDYYKKVYETYGHDPSKMQIGVHSHAFVSTSKEDVFENYYPRYARQMDKIGKERGWKGSYTKEQFINGTDMEGALFMGEPKQVAEKIILICETFGLTRFVAHIDSGGPTHKEMMSCIELLGKEVFPIVKKHFNKD